MKILVALVVLIVAPVFAQSAVEFKGLQAGASVAIVQAAHPLATCARSERDGGMVCDVADTTWATLPVSVRFAFDDTGLAAVTVQLKSAANYSSAWLALREKYGHPPDNTAPVGDSRSTWKIGDGVIIASQTAGVNGPTVRFATNAWQAANLDRIRARNAAMLKAKAGDM